MLQQTTDYRAMRQAEAAHMHPTIVLSARRGTQRQAPTAATRFIGYLIYALTAVVWMLALAALLSITLAQHLKAGGGGERVESADASAEREFEELELIESHARLILLPATAQEGVQP